MHHMVFPFGNLTQNLTAYFYKKWNTILESRIGCPKYGDISCPICRKGKFISLIENLTSSQVLCFDCEKQLLGIRFLFSMESWSRKKCVSRWKSSIQKRWHNVASNTKQGNEINKTLQTLEEEEEPQERNFIRMKVEG